jgi:hypothetical protein
LQVRDDVSIVVEGSVTSTVDASTFCFLVVVDFLLDFAPTGVVVIVVILVGGGAALVGDEANPSRIAKDDGEGGGGARILDGTEERG